MLLALALLLASITQPHPVREFQPRPTYAIGKFRPIEPCYKGTDPETADSPTPILNNLSFARVSFFVDDNGRVQSAFILISNGSRASDSMVLRVINTWRFHPATCNGVPVDAEGLVTFVRQ